MTLDDIYRAETIPGSDDEIERNLFATCRY